MKAYVITTGIVFALVTVAHIWRILAGESHLATEPVFILLTVATATLSFWAWRLFRLLSRS